MSSGAQRDPLSGVIRQGKKVVGAIVIPDASDVFIREFNHCYGQLRMSVTPSDQPRTSPESHPHTFRLPDWFRHVWHASQSAIDPSSPDLSGPELNSPELNRSTSPPSEPTTASSSSPKGDSIEPGLHTNTPIRNSQNQQPRRRRPSA
ncbi:MAG: hypothetical protein ACK5OB_08115 [Pirellula sp.]